MYVKKIAEPRKKCTALMIQEKKVDANAAGLKKYPERAKKRYRPFPLKD